MLHCSSEKEETDLFYSFEKSWFLQEKKIFQEDPT